MFSKKTQDTDHPGANIWGSVLHPEDLFHFHMAPLPVSKCFAVLLNQDTPGPSHDTLTSAAIDSTVTKA